MKPTPRVVGTVLVSAFLFACVGGFTGCGHSVDRTIGDRIADQLPRILGPAESYNVQVDAGPLSVMHGHFHEVIVIGKGVQVSPALLIDELDIQAHDVDVDTRSRTIQSVGLTTLQAHITQGDVDHYLEFTSASGKRPANFHIELNQQDVTSTFDVRSAGLSVGAQVEGQLQVDGNDPAEVDFSPSGGSIGKVPVPKLALRLLLAHINPIVDLRYTRVPLVLNSVTVSSREIVLAGTASLTLALLKKS